MKKAKILSAFLSLTLSITSFGAVPVTVSAADTEIDASALDSATVGATTTTTTPAQTAVTNTTTANIRRTTTTPPPVTTTSIAVNEAEEGKLTAVINIYDDETYEEIKGLHVQFVEYEHDWNNNEEIPEIVRVIADWNTNDTSQMVIENIDSIAGHFYAVKIDEFPENYCYSWDDHCIQGIHVYGDGALTGTRKYNVGISHHAPLPTLEYPLDIERKCTFSVADMSTNEIVEGLDVELAQMELDPEVVNKYNYVKTIDTWNTGDEPTHSINISMHFDSASDPNYVYGIKINNMPEGYTYRLPDYDGYYIESYYGPGDYQYDLYSKNDVTEWDYYIKPDGYRPHYTTTTTTTQFSGTTTTSTTTTSEPTTELTYKAKVKFSVIDANSSLPIDGINVSVNAEDNITFNTSDDPEPIKEICYSIKHGDSAYYKVTVSDLPNEYGYEDNVYAEVFYLYPQDNGSIVDWTLKIYKKASYVTTDTNNTTDFVKGDANCDGELSMADAVLIMQAVANPDKFGTNGTEQNHLTDKGKRNADIAGERDGISVLDALAIQKKLLKIE